MSEDNPRPSTSRGVPESEQCVPVCTPEPRQHPPLRRICGQNLNHNMLQNIIPQRDSDPQRNREPQRNPQLRLFSRPNGQSRWNANTEWYLEPWYPQLQRKPQPNLDFHLNAAPLQNSDPQGKPQPQCNVNQSGNPEPERSSVQQPNPESQQNASAQENAGGQQNPNPHENLDLHTNQDPKHNINQEKNVKNLDPMQNPEPQRDPRGNDNPQRILETQQNSEPQRNLTSQQNPVPQENPEPQRNPVPPVWVHMPQQHRWPVMIKGSPQYMFLLDNRPPTPIYGAAFAGQYHSAPPPLTFAPHLGPGALSNPGNPIPRYLTPETLASIYPIQQRPCEVDFRFVRRPTPAWRSNCTMTTRAEVHAMPRAGSRSLPRAHQIRMHEDNATFTRPELAFGAPQKNLAHRPQGSPPSEVKMNRRSVSFKDQRQPEATAEHDPSQTPTKSTGKSTFSRFTRYMSKKVTKTMFHRKSSLEIAIEAKTTPVLKDMVQATPRRSRSMERPLTLHYGDESDVPMRQSCHRLLEHQQAGGDEPPIYTEQISVVPEHVARDGGGKLTRYATSEEDEATLRELLIRHSISDVSRHLQSQSERLQRLNRLQRQVSVMSMNLSAKLDDLQRGDRQLETTVALCEIRSQLQELTKSVESCQSEVSEVKRDMVAIKQELDTVQQVKEEIEELREYVDRLEEHSQRRKLRLLEQGLTFFLSYAILAAVLGMLQFGYNTGVINAPGRNIENFMKDVYKDRYGKDIHEDTVNRLYSIAVSIFAIGGMLGGFSGGMIANRFGRKGGLLLNNILGISGASLMGFTKISHCYEMLFFGRFIIGVNCGLNTSLVPMYISEIAPLNLRGGLGTVNQLAVTVGLLLSQVLGIEQILGTDEGWPILLGLAICPAVLQLILLPACPESPRYLLITRQWEEEARRALRRLRASNQVEEDIEEMRAEERAQQAEASISMRELLCSPTLRAPLLIGVVMQLSQQLSGINAVFYYSTSLFTSSGLTEESAKFATMGIGAIMVGMTLVSLPLMDRTGRRTLHLYGLGGMFIFSIFITISFLIKEMIDWMSYLSVVSTLSFVVFFAVGPGSIPWLITAELFSQGPRPSAMAIAVLVNWMANFVVGIGFPSMKALLENYTFLPFSVFLAIFWIFTYKKVPETKNKTFEEILALFRNSNGRDSFRDNRLYGSMMNCVNALEQQLPPPPPPAPHPDEKHDSLSEQSSGGGEATRAPPLPPPRFPAPGNV